MDSSHLAKIVEHRINRPHDQEQGTITKARYTPPPQDGIWVGLYPDDYCGNIRCLNLVICKPDEDRFHSLEGYYARLRDEHQRPIGVSVIANGKAQFALDHYPTVFIEMMPPETAVGLDFGPPGH